MPETKPDLLTGTVLVADDDAAQREYVTSVLSAQGHQVRQAADGSIALQILADIDVDVLVSDLRMPGVDGLMLLRAAAARTPPTPTVIVTAYATVDTAIEAMKLGAVDYVVKPAAPPDLQTAVHRALERRRMISGVTASIDEETSSTGLLGISTAMAGVHEQIRRAAPYKCTVLITGESGTGKELAARGIHSLGDAEGPFVDVNCAALPRDLMESQLFGHEKGAFTGADQRRKGLFEQASGGTLFLDEFIELTPEAQAKLLRALEERQIRRLGGSESIAVDVRVLAAANVDPEVAVAEGTLRADLYYRLNVLSVVMPPLRERPDDIPLLVQVFLDRFAAANDRPPRDLAPNVVQALQIYDWPGNVRELKNAIERLAVMAPGDPIQLDDLASALPSVVRTPSIAAGDDADSAQMVDVMVEEGMTLQEIEQQAIQSALRRAEGNRTQAARLLGISVRTLHRRLKEAERSDQN